MHKQKQRGVSGDGGRGDSKFPPRDCRNPYVAKHGQDKLTPECEAMTRVRLSSGQNYLFSMTSPYNVQSLLTTETPDSTPHALLSLKGTV